MKILSFILMTLIPLLVQAGWVADQSGDLKICKVSLERDLVSNPNSLRAKVEKGYNLPGVSFCHDKIILERSITLSSPLTLKATNDFDGLIIEGNAENPPVIDLSGAGTTCALTLESDRITFKNVILRGATGDALCIKSSFNKLENVIIESSNRGVVIEGQQNRIVDSVFRNNRASGIDLRQAATNVLTGNSYYSNHPNISSSLSNMTPVIESANKVSDTAYTIFVKLPVEVDAVEFYRSYPRDGNITTFIQSVTDFDGFFFETTIPGLDGESVYALAIKDGATSATSNEYLLSADNSGNNGGSSQTHCPLAEGANITRDCNPGVGSPYRYADSDCDGVYDNDEDLNKNCKWDQATETNATDPDTDHDGLPDNKEARFIDGAWETGKTDPLNDDTDGDLIADGDEDFNHDGLKGGNESSPLLKDTDGDGLSDTIEDANLNGRWETGETKAYYADTDNDGLADGVEDKNKNGRVDKSETDPLKYDSDGDDFNDSDDACPLDPDPDCLNACTPGEPDCEKACIKGETPSQYIDSDEDGLPNILEDVDHDCVRDLNETNFLSADTDGDGIPDGVEDSNANGTFDSGETNPRVADTDGDGIKDGVEDKNHNGRVDPGETDPRVTDVTGEGDRPCIPGLPLANPNQDWDHDGILDSVEDKNGDCKWQFSETDASDPDTDNDNLPDGIEDKNRNGVVDENETDPHNPDTDGDGITDGLEDSNLNGLRDFTECSSLSRDTDGDGIPDNKEDLNSNGIFDAGESSCYQVDSDFDGLKDNVEDKNLNGIKDPDETSSTNADTDGDGATDAIDPNPLFKIDNDFNKSIGKKTGGCSLVEGSQSSPTVFVIFLISLMGMFAIRLWSSREPRRQV